MAITLPPLPARGSVLSSPSSDFARLRLSSPESLRPAYNARLERPRPVIHRRAYSLNYSSPTIHLPLPQRDTVEPRTLPPMRTSPPSPPRVRAVASSSPPQTRPARRPAPQKRTILVNPSLAAHLQKGGVVAIAGKDGRRLKLYLPPRVIRV